MAELSQRKSLDTRSGVPVFVVERPIGVRLMLAVHPLEKV